MLSLKLKLLIIQLIYLSRLWKMWPSLVMELDLFRFDRFIRHLIDLFILQYILTTIMWAIIIL